MHTLGSTPTKADAKAQHSNHKRNQDTRSPILYDEPRASKRLSNDKAAIGKQSHYGQKKNANIASEHVHDTPAPTSFKNPAKYITQYHKKQPEVNNSDSDSDGGPPELIDDAQSRSNSLVLAAIAADSATTAPASATTPTAATHANESEPPASATTPTDATHSEPAAPASASTSTPAPTPFTFDANASNQVLPSIAASSNGHANFTSTVDDAECSPVNEILRMAGHRPNEVIAMNDFNQIMYVGAAPNAWAHATLPKVQEQVAKCHSPGPRDTTAMSLPSKGVMVTPTGKIHDMPCIIAVVTFTEGVRTIQTGIRTGTTNGHNWAVSSIHVTLASGELAKIVYWGADAHAFIPEVYTMLMTMHQAKCPRIAILIKKNCICTAKGIINCFNFNGPSGYNGDRAVATFTARTNMGPGLSKPEMFLWNALAFNHRQPPPGKKHAHITSPPALTSRIVLHLQLQPPHHNTTAASDVIPHPFTWGVAGALQPVQAAGEDFEIPLP